jgi:hypothetical protein
MIMAKIKPIFTWEQISLFADPDPVTVEFPDYFDRNMVKVLRAGFTLVVYDRINKHIKIAEADGINTRWVGHPDAPFKTYAQAERTLDLMLKDPAVVDTSENGFIGCWKKLTAAGFDFYRTEDKRIKQGSKNWGTWRKFITREECLLAWEELMKSEKALRA